MKVKFKLQLSNNYTETLNLEKNCWIIQIFGLLLLPPLPLPLLLHLPRLLLPGFLLPLHLRGFPNFQVVWTTPPLPQQGGATSTPNHLLALRPLNWSFQGGVTSSPIQGKGLSSLFSSLLLQTMCYNHSCHTCTPPCSYSALELRTSHQVLCC